MSATSGNSWYFDSGCYNHMTSDSTIFISKNSTSHTSLIKTVDGSQLHVTYIGLVFTFNLSLPSTFHIHKLTNNLIYVGQLCDIGLNVVFSSFGGVLNIFGVKQLLLLSTPLIVILFLPSKTNHHMKDYMAIHPTINF